MIKRTSPRIQLPHISGVAPKSSLRRFLLRLDDRFLPRYHARRFCSPWAEIHLPFPRPRPFLLLPLRLPLPVGLTTLHPSPMQI